MNPGDPKKDQPGFFTRRRPQTFGLEESARNGGQFSSPVLPLPFSNSMTTSHRQIFNYWPSQNYHQPHGHHVGSRHRYAGHQMFMQHGPFGGESNRYRPVGYLPQFRMRFPQSSELQRSPIFNGEPRRNGLDYQCDRRHFEDAAKNRFDYGGQSRGFKIDQGARPKSGKFPSSKIKVHRKKSNQISSSNVSSQDKEADKVGNRLKKKCKNNNELCLNEIVTMTDKSCMKNSSEQNGNSQKLDYGLGEKTDSCSPLHLDGKFSEHHFSASKEEYFVDEEGAVGGSDYCEDVQQTDDSLQIKEDQKFDGCSFDKNLIDEGAICDLDKMFQHQEFALYNSDNSDECQSDSDIGICAVQADEDTDVTSRKHTNNLHKNLLDEESESENCSYVYNPQPTHLRKDFQCPDHPQCSHEKATISCSQILNQHTYGEDKRADLSAEGRFECAIRNGHVGDISDDGEDTGDFIDTDLPSHNKHILSSSDEMDNISSSSSSDHESSTEMCGDYRCRKPAIAEFSCNDLSSSDPKVQNELQAMSISERTDKLNTSLSSHFHTNGDTERIRGSSPTLVRRATSCSSSSSSESENEDSSPLGSHSPLNAAQISLLPYVCYNSTSACLDGAAASQVSSEGPQKHLDDPYNSCPPGADCEIPQDSSQCFFHSDILCHGGRPGSCNNTKSSQSPAREYIAFTASSALDSSDACAQMHKQEFATCSAISDGGACCLPGYQLPQVNDLNACCHHNHSHVANGFSNDRPETNFNNDESNKHQKVFVKFPVEDNVDEKGSHSASSGDLEDIDGFSISTRKQDKSSDSGGSEDPLSHDSGDNVDMVLLPMEEEIEPVHHMSGGLCAGGVEDTDEFYHDIQLATGNLQGVNMSHLSCDEHQYLCVHDQSPLRHGMPSKEFYDLIKTVSTTDSYMRFFDKDGQDVQRQPFTPCDDDDTSKLGVTAGGQSSKTERLKVDRVMIWNEYEAYVMQFKQIAVSACGQTAVLNVLKALKFSFEKSAVCKIIQTSLRKDDACIPEYLFSRAKAGTTAEELMLGVEKLSGGAVGGRFFHFWPPRKVKLLQWLAYWMKRGAIPIATLNLQQGPHSLWQVPDSWHHQMVYGVSHQGLYLTNPLEIVSERSAMKQLCSDSVLMVRRQDIISRFRETTDLSQLLDHPDPRWRTMNVLGQVVNVLREFNMPSVPGYRLQVTSHVSIPASYKAGITLFMTKDKSAWTTLMNAPEIPLEE